ncbi:hypothetical protein DNTS_012018, partial [Danionella cerebrum]
MRGLKPFKTPLSHFPAFGDMSEYVMFVLDSLLHSPRIFFKPHRDELNVAISAVSIPSGTLTDCACSWTALAMTKTSACGHLCYQPHSHWHLPWQMLVKSRVVTEDNESGMFLKAVSRANTGQQQHSNVTININTHRKFISAAGFTTVHHKRHIPEHGRHVSKGIHIMGGREASSPEQKKTNGCMYGVLRKAWMNSSLFKEMTGQLQLIIKSIHTNDLQWCKKFILGAQQPLGMMAADEPSDYRSLFPDFTVFFLPWNHSGPDSSLTAHKAEFADCEEWGIWEALDEPCEQSFLTVSFLQVRSNLGNGRARFADEIEFMTILNK